MKLGLVYRDYCHPSYGGIGAHVHELGHALGALGHAVTVVATGWGPRRSQRQQVAGYEVDLEHYPRWPARLRLPSIVWNGARRLRRHAREGVELFHWHEEIYGGLEGWLLPPAPPRVMTIHSSWYLAQLESSSGRALLKLLTARSHAFIAPSDELADGVERIVGRRAHMIPNGVDPERFHPGLDPALERTRLGLEPATLLVGCPRRLVHKNGVDLLLRAWPRVREDHPGARLLLVGDGPERERLQRLAQELELGSSLIWAGALGNDRMPEVHSACELVVLPSRREATSIAALEAMACGRCVVASRVGGLPLLLEDGAGELVPPEDPEALARTLARLLGDRELRARLGSAARQRVEQRFSWRRIAERTLEVYRSLLDADASTGVG